MVTKSQPDQIKLPPNDNDAEESVLGSIIIDDEVMRDVENIVKTEDFYFEDNRKVYAACVALKERREAINQVTLAQELKRRLSGIEDYHLAYLVSVVPTALDAEHYARIVRRLSISRQMIELGESITSKGYLDHPETNKAIEDVVNKVNEFRENNTMTDSVVNAHGAADIVFDLMEEYKQPKKAIPYGFSKIDEITSGIYPELIIIGARPSVGKTQIMLDFMENILDTGKRVLFASAEMSVPSIMERRVARELKTDIKQLRKGNLTTAMMDKMANLAGKIASQQVFYLPQGVSSHDIYAETKRLVDTAGIDIVFVDYLQLLRDCWDGNARDNQVVRVGRACKVLKSIVNDFKIPLICASQLNRSSEYRSGDNRYPVLADLRESGDIEQDADIVFLLHRDKETDNLDGTINSKLLRVTMAKNRQLGWSPAVQLVWDENNRRYGD